MREWGVGGEMERLLSKMSLVCSDSAKVQDTKKIFESVSSVTGAALCREQLFASTFFSNDGKKLFLSSRTEKKGETR
jgi:hypothetical protein